MLITCRIIDAQPDNVMDVNVFDDLCQNLAQLFHANVIGIY